MGQVKFGIYALSVYHPKSRELLGIDDVGGGRTFYDVAMAALKSRSATVMVKEKSDGTGKATQFVRLDEDGPGRIVYGVGQQGGFGQGSTLLNVRTSDRTERERVQADLLPYYFYLDCAGDSKQAVLLVQVSGLYSLRATIFELIQVGLRAIDETLQLKSEGCIPGDVLKALAREGTVKTIQVEKRNVSQDRVDSALQSRQTGTLKLTYSVSKGLGRNWKDRLGLGTRATMATFIPGDGLKEFEDYDSLKVQVKVGKSTKTIDLGRLGDPQPSLLPDQDKIATGADGNPMIEDIHVLAKAEVEKLRKEFDDAV